MRRRRSRAIILPLAIGLLVGAGFALWYGWVVSPLQYTDTDIAHLHPSYRNDLVLMVGEAYAMDADLDKARARLALLAVSDPTTLVADLADKAIAQNEPLAHIRALARLAAALGVQRDSLRPYQSGAAGAS
jgi:hypothetical protein